MEWVSEQQHQHHVHGEEKQILVLNASADHQFYPKRCVHHTSTLSTSVNRPRPPPQLLRKSYLKIKTMNNHRKRKKKPKKETRQHSKQRRNYLSFYRFPQQVFIQNPPWGRPAYYSQPQMLMHAQLPKQDEDWIDGDPRNIDFHGEKMRALRIWEQVTPQLRHKNSSCTYCFEG